MGPAYVIDVKTLTLALNDKESVAVVIKILGKEFDQIWTTDESYETKNKNEFSLELLQRIYLISIDGSSERLDNFLIKTGYRGHLLP